MRLWSASGNSYEFVEALTTHSAEVSSIAVHPSHTLLASAALDSTWALHDLASGKPATALLNVTVPPASADSGAIATGGATSIAFHPDGAILAVGCGDSFLRVFDVRTAKMAAMFAGHSAVGGGAVAGLSFSENGYMLGSCSAGTGGAVQIWDLRKLSNLRSIATPPDAKVNTVRFDPSAQYLATAGTSLHVYQNKTWDELLSFDGNAADLTGLAFAKSGREIIVAGIDRSVRVLSTTNVET